MIQKLAAEALGALFLVATVVGSGIMAETLSGGNIGIALLANSLATGAILFVLITMFAPVSGAHFNPAVTFAFLLRREISLPLGGAYIFVQMVAGVLGTVLAHAMFEQPLIQEAQTVRTGAAQWLSEVVATFALVLTILETLRARPQAVPTAVALVIMAGYWYTASTSFANPAVTLARAFTDSFSGIAPINVAPFIAAQIVGSLLAWLVSDHIFKWRRVG
jgi:glycerol uptake facilitator-like aquaporin